MNEVFLNFWKYLGDIALAHWIATIGLCSLFIFCRYSWKYIKSQWRFGNNLRRKIYFLKTSETKNLQTEMDKLKNLNIFNIEEDIKDISRNTNLLQNMNNNAVHIVGYNEQYNSYNELFSVAKQHKIPIIIFANAGEIKSQEHWKIFNSYIYCDVANSTNRVAIILINIMKIV